MTYPLRTILCVSLLLACASPARADVLDLIPDDAAGALAIANLKRFNERANQVNEDSGSFMGIQPSMLGPMVFGYFGVNQGADYDAPVAVIFANREKSGARGTGPMSDFDKMMVLAAPFTDLDTIAANFGFNKGEFKAERYEQRNSRVLYARGKHLLIGVRKEAVQSVVEGKSVGAGMADHRRFVLGQADAVAYLGPRAWGQVWRDVVGGVSRSMAIEGDAEGDRVAKRMIETLGAVRYAVAGLRLDGGVGVNLEVVFPDDAEGEAAKFLAELRGGEGASHLAFLPGEGGAGAGAGDGPARGARGGDREVLWAYAATGDGRKNAAIARTMLKITMTGLSDAMQLPLTPDDRLQVLDVMGGMWQRLRGSRSALYRTADAARGLVAGVAILDTEDAEAFVAQMNGVLDVTNTAAARAAAQAGVAPARFAYQPNAQSLDDTRIDVITLAEHPFDEAGVERISRLLGPDWRTIRLANVGQRVVVLLGSDTSLLKQTLANLRDGAAGLADARPVAAAAQRLDPMRKLELHFDFHHAWLVGNQLKGFDITQQRENVEWTSFGLTLEPDRMQLDVWLPSDQVRKMVFMRGL